MPYIELALALSPEELEKQSGHTFLHSVARHTREPRALRDQVVAVLLAGRDTTAATLSFLCFTLTRRQDIVKRLRDELDGVADNGVGSLDILVLQQLPYLNAVLKEGEWPVFLPYVFPDEVFSSSPVLRSPQPSRTYCPSFI